MDRSLCCHVLWLVQKGNFYTCNHINLLKNRVEAGTDWEQILTGMDLDWVIIDGKHPINHSGHTYMYVINTDKVGEII